MILALRGVEAQREYLFLGLVETKWNQGMYHSSVAKAQKGGPASVETTRKKSTFPPLTFTKVRFSSLISKIGQITSLNFSNRAFYLPGAVSKAVLLQ
jgi:hypothetical protein